MTARQVSPLRAPNALSGAWEQGVSYGYASSLAGTPTWPHAVRSGLRAGR